MDRRVIVLKQVAKYAILCISVFVLYILQSTPGFFKIFGIKPVFIIPFCVALSMFDDDRWAGLVCLLGGLLSDMSRGRIAGFFTILLLIACMGGLIASKFFFKVNVRNCVIFSFFAMFIILSFDFFFRIILSGPYTGKFVYYFKNVFLLSAYSCLFSALFYKYIRFVYGRFLPYDAR